MDTYLDRLDAAVKAPQAPSQAPGLVDKVTQSVAQGWESAKAAVSGAIDSVKGWFNGSKDLKLDAQGPLNQGSRQAAAIDKAGVGKD